MIKDEHKYDDILYLEHHVSKTHKHMSLYERAAQFAPFAALNGHSAALVETARLTHQKKILDESQMRLLNDRLLYLAHHDASAVFTYFEKDLYKEGGSYKSVEGKMSHYDSLNHKIIVNQEYEIFIDDLIDIRCEEYDSYYHVDMI